MSAASPKVTNTNIEQHYFERFRAARPLMDGIPCYGDKPDVIVHGERNIGVEITNFFLQSGSLPESEQRQRPMRTAVVSKAHALYRSGGGKGIELTVAFDASHPITPKRRKELPVELAELAKRCHNRPGGQLENSLLVSMPEIASVHLNRWECPDAKWRLNGFYTFGLMSEVALQSVIREKEAKSAEYRPCDAYWLLVVVDGVDPAQEQEIRVDGLKIPSGVFERVFVYKPGFEHILEVWP